MKSWFSTSCLLLALFIEMSAAPSTAQSSDNNSTEIAERLNKIEKKLDSALEQLEILRDGRFVPVPEAGAKTETVDAQFYRVYMKDVNDRIKKAWHPPRDIPYQKTTMKFKISSDGNISDLKVKAEGDHGPGGPFVQAAATAIRSAAPFNALPPSAPKAIEILFNFDYNEYTNRYFGQGPANGR